MIFEITKVNNGFVVTKGAKDMYAFENRIGMELFINKLIEEEFPEGGKDDRQQELFKPSDYMGGL